jgi:hypothetical protein
MIMRHGKDAALQAANRADELLAVGQKSQSQWVMRCVIAPQAKPAKTISRGVKLVSVARNPALRPSSDAWC